MLSLDLTRQARDFLNQLDPKQFRQVVKKILGLMEDPRPSDAQALKGYPFWRADIGEYRIIFVLDPDTESLKVPLIGNRNDGAVYDELRRL